MIFQNQETWHHETCMKNKHCEEVSLSSLSTSRLKVVAFTALSGISPIREFPWDLAEFSDYARPSD